MNERISWIDWGKAVAVCTVVFCHLPQSQEWFYYRYLQATIISIFFFLSGYLKKERKDGKVNWQKYWQGLILPYLLYNAMVYPYWIGRYSVIHGELPDLLQAAKPLMGALLLEHECHFAEPLNGPLWYLPAVLIMHLITDLCRKTRYQHTLLIVLCLLSCFLYAANKYWEFLPNLTPMGVFARLPYYYIGYVMGQRRLFRDSNGKRDFAGMTVCLALSLVLFYWHLHTDTFLWHITLFYPVNFCFVFAVLFGSKLLDGYRPRIVTTLSVGTLVIIGLHAPLIGIINFAVERLSGMEPPLCYQWFEAVFAAILVCMLLYPVILTGIKQAPVLIGKRRAIPA